eukprot:scaffold302_cov247-Pinguiococcus_pyrenoidosus.AAC.1
MLPTVACAGSWRAPVLSSTNFGVLHPPSPSCRCTMQARISCILPSINGAYRESSTRLPKTMLFFVFSSFSFSSVTFSLFCEMSLFGLGFLAFYWSSDSAASRFCLQAAITTASASHQQKATTKPTRFTTSHEVVAAVAAATAAAATAASAKAVQYQQLQFVARPYCAFPLHSLYSSNHNNCTSR